MFKSHNRGDRYIPGRSTVCGSVLMPAPACLRLPYVAYACRSTMYAFSFVQVAYLHTL